MTQARSDRRLLLLGLALGGGYLVAGRALPTLSWFKEDFVFEDIDRPAGFRRIRAGATSSGGFDPFVGIGGTGPAEVAPSAVLAVREDICCTLFEGWTPDSDTVPVASFSDYKCPIRRVTTRRIAGATPVQDGTAQVTWHELPILDETSGLAAKAALAADEQAPTRLSRTASCRARSSRRTATSTRSRATATWTATAWPATWQAPRSRPGSPEASRCATSSASAGRPPSSSAAPWSKATSARRRCRA